VACAETEGGAPVAYLWASDWLDDALRSVTAAVRAAGLCPRVAAPDGDDFVPPADGALFILGERVGSRTGLELLLCLRATEETRQIPALLFGPGRHSTILAAWQAGADAYLTDPSSPDLTALAKQLTATGAE
jgi:CheY-like chemotaxis protein